MNNSINKGKWRELKGEIKKNWGDLTESEIEKTEGNLDQIAGKIQQKYGETVEQARGKLNKMLDNISDRM